MKCTDTGRVVYDRKPHEFTWRDAFRIVRKIPAPICANIDQINLAANVIGKILTAIADCPRDVRRGFIIALFSIMAKDAILDLLEVDFAPDSPVDSGSRESGFGGAGTSGEFGRTPAPRSGGSSPVAQGDRPELEAAREFSPPEEEEEEELNPPDINYPYRRPVPGEDSS